MEFNFWKTCCLDKFATKLGYLQSKIKLTKKKLINFYEYMMDFIQKSHLILVLILVESKMYFFLKANEIK